MEWNDDERKPNPGLKRSSPQYESSVKKTNIYKEILDELDSRKRNIYNDIEYKEIPYEFFHVKKEKELVIKEVSKEPEVEVLEPELDPRFAYM